MGNLKFDDGIGEVKTPVAPGELKLFNGEGGEVPKANDGLCSGDECLCESANSGCKNGAGENAHVKVKADGKAANQHEPGCIPGWLIAGRGDHVPQQLRILAGGGVPRMGLSSENVDGSGVGGK